MRSLKVGLAHALPLTLCPSAPRGTGWTREAKRLLPSQPGRPLETEMIQRMLLPLDGSSLAEFALPYGRALHRTFGSEVILLRVVESEPEHKGLFSESKEWRLAESEARCYLNRVAGRLEGWDVPTEIDVASGEACDEILAATRRWGADLVIVASRGEGRADTSPHGGTAGKVLSSAHTSFLLVHPPTSEGPSDFSLRRIVVPVDGSPRGAWALNQAALLARTNGAELCMVHVVLRPDVLRFPAAAAEARGLADRLVEVNREAAVRYLEERKRQLASPDLPIEAEVVVADSVPRAIHELAARTPGSLLVLSAHGRSGGAGWTYGGVASALLSHGSVPILVFQDLPRRRRGRTRPAGRYARATARPGSAGGA